MVVATKLIAVEEAIQSPLIVDWPVGDWPVLHPPKPYIERWPVVEPAADTPPAPTPEERLRQLTEDPRPFRDWLLTFGNKISGHSYDGTRCPWALYVQHELGTDAPQGGVYVNVHQTGLHPCMYRGCERFAHVPHSPWLREFVYMVDAGQKGRGVRGRSAVAFLDAAVTMTAAARGRAA